MKGIDSLVSIVLYLLGHEPFGTIQDLARWKQTRENLHMPGRLSKIDSGTCLRLVGHAIKVWFVCL
jgi:hypothetical protein